MTQHPSTLNRLNKEKSDCCSPLLGPSTLAHPADSCCAVGGCLFVGLKLSCWRFQCPKDGCRRRHVEVEAAWFQGLGAAVIAMNAVVMGGEIPSGLWMVSKKWGVFIRSSVYHQIKQYAHTWADSNACIYKWHEMILQLVFFSSLGWKDSVKWSK